MINDGFGKNIGFEIGFEIGLEIAFEIGFLNWIQNKKKVQIKSH